MTKTETRDRVAAAWKSGKAANAGNLMTAAGAAYSYAHQIGRTEADGRRVLIDCHYSKTTREHVNALRAAADAVEPCSKHG